MDLIKVKIKVLTTELSVADVDTRFCTPSQFELTATKDIITDPTWSWHPCYRVDTYRSLPHHHEEYTVHCTKLGTLTKIKQNFRTSMVDPDAPVLMLNELQIKNFMKWYCGTIEDNEGYIAWLSDDEDFIIERVFPDKSYSAFYPLRVSGEWYPDYREYTTWWKK